MFECGTCGRGFPSGWRAREQHLEATGHREPDNECQRCDRVFKTQTACWQHMNALNHFAYDCRVSGCEETWPTEAGRRDHEVNVHWWCNDCNRGFQNLNNIKMHLNSNIHRGRNMKCPFCKGPYATATGLTHHLESGACPSAPNINRDNLYKFVRTKDPAGAISKNLIGWYGSESYEATEQAWNRHTRDYECYLCHRHFRSLASLNQHLSSPAHQQPLYHCPGCRREFTSLAGLINHLESESCGYTRFETVQKQVYNVVSSDRRIAF